MLTGIVSDWAGRRAIIMVPMLFFSAFCMLMIRLYLDKGAMGYYFLMFLVGIFLGGPYNIICTAVMIDLS